MKLFKTSLTYFIIIMFLYHLYDTRTLCTILFDYPRIDFKYLIFVIIQFYWSALLYHIIYQYITLYQLMKIRIPLWQCYSIIVIRNILYCIFYIGIHVCINQLLSLSIDFSLLLYNLIIQIISFWIVIIFKGGWEYSYIFMNILILLLHFIV